jgi:hypothetical protein
MVRVSQTLNAEKSWARLKANPEKLEEYYKKQRQYRRSNPRTYLKYRQEMRDVARDLNNCPQCLRPKDEKDLNSEYKLCSKCREYARNYGRKLREAKKNETIRISNNKH